MAILDDMKILLRISNTAFDAEITDLIASAEADLAISGIYNVDNTDVLTKRAISTYVKANFGWDNLDAERLMGAYDLLKNHMTLSLDYVFYKVTINTSEQQLITFDTTVRETNDSGTAIFYTRAKDHIPYIIAGEISYVDVTEDVVINVV